jgi:hypothetical protein
MSLLSFVRPRPGPNTRRLCCLTAGGQVMLLMMRNCSSRRREVFITALLYCLGPLFDSAKGMCIDYNAGTFVVLGLTVE